MDFWDLTKLLVRRWVVVLPLLLLSIGLAGLAMKSVKPDYKATAHVQLVPPVSGGTQPGQSTAEQRNPWLGLGLQAIGNAAIVTVTDQSVVLWMHNNGYSDSYTVTLGDNSPLITFEIVATSPEQARQTTEEVVNRLTTGVASLQTSYRIATADLITARRLDVGVTVVKSTSKVKRAAVAVGGAGLLTTAGATVGIDAWLNRRRRRREEAALAVAPTAAANGTAAGPPRQPERVGSIAAGNGRSTPDMEMTAVIQMGNGWAASKERSPVSVQVDRAKAAQRDRPETDADKQREGKAPVRAGATAGEPEQEPLPMPSDATIVLPIPPSERIPWIQRSGEKS